MSETKQYDYHPTVNRFVENHGADRYEETNAAISENKATGYIDPSECVTLFGEDVRIHPDVGGSPYGVDVNSLVAVSSTSETTIGDNDRDAYEFESPKGETHTIDAKYVRMVANVFECDVSELLEHVKVKNEWSDFPVLFEHPEGENVRMMVAPFIAH